MSSSPTPSEPPLVVSQRELADVFGVTARTVQRWETAGMPGRLEDDDELRYDAGEAVRWRVEIAESTSDLAQERLRTLQVQRRRKELELAEYEGTLITAEAHRKALGEAFDFVRQNLLNLPGVLAPQLVGVGDAREVASVVEAAVNRALSSLVDRADDVTRMDELPEDLPGHTWFVKAGIGTWTELERLESVEAVRGIGPKTARRLRAWLEEQGRA